MTNTEKQQNLVALLYAEALRRCDGDHARACVVLFDVLNECGLCIKWVG
jgi:hypothetical protein